MLILSIVLLAAELFWPTARHWWRLPAPGQIGVGAFSSETLADEFAIRLPQHYSEKAEWPLVVFCMSVAIAAMIQLLFDKNKHFASSLRRSARLRSACRLVNGRCEVYSGGLKIPRVVPLCPPALTLLSAQQRLGRWVFTAPRTAQFPESDRQIDERRALYHLQKTLKPLGLKGKLHSFRHSLISHALASGTPEATARAWAGHVDGQIKDIAKAVRKRTTTPMHQLKYQTKRRHILFLDHLESNAADPI